MIRNAVSFIRNNFLGFAKKASTIITAVALVVGGFFVSAPFAFAAISTITVTSPNGGEIWSGTHNITWTSTKMV